MTALRTVADALLAPERGLPAAVGRRAALAPIVVATVASVLLAIAVAQRGDWDGMVAARLDAAPQAEGAAPTEHEREEALLQATKLARTGAWAGAIFLPALSAAGAALALALAFRLAGARPPLPAALAATSAGLLPGAVRDLATIPALVRHAPVRPDEVPQLLPSSVAALLPRGAAAPLASAAASLDLFALWSVALVALGMSRAAGVPFRRALLVTALAWIAWVAVFRVSVPALLAPPR